MIYSYLQITTSHTLTLSHSHTLLFLIVNLQSQNGCKSKARLERTTHGSSESSCIFQTGLGFQSLDDGIKCRSPSPAICHSGFIPLYVGKLIIDEVIMLNRDHGNTSTHHLWMLIGAEFLLALFNDALGRSISLLDSLLGDLFGKLSSIRIMKHAAILDLEQFEDPVFYDKLERARQQTTGRTILLSQVFSQVQDLITMGFLAAGLILFNPWLIVLLFITILPSFIGESYFNDQTYALEPQANT